MATSGATETLVLLRRLHDGDAAALHALVERHLPFIRALVRRRIGAGMRQGAETEDFVQDACVNVLRYAPRFVVDDDQHFRALLARAVENSILDKHKWFAARRRRRADERPLPTESVLDLRRAGSTPSEQLDRREHEAWVRLALELLEPDDREVVVRRDWDREPFAAIGERLRIAEDAARMRYVRALRKLTVLVTRLRRGDVADLVDAESEGETP
ncbi:MAG TPA: sigma-70 family RNA polymerase sigma factor [Planctomycetota bacterium]|nr:sigma-70 family RNA polymerase sigma factor [Planctomycetota bacterium]